MSDHQIDPNVDLNTTLGLPKSGQSSVYSHLASFLTELASVQPSSEKKPNANYAKGDKSIIKILVIIMRVGSVGWILSYGVRAHLNKDKGQLRMLSCIFIFYMCSLALLLAFEATVRYIQILYFMIYFSNLGGFLILRALQKSVEQYQPIELLVAQRRIYAIMIVLYTFNMMNGVNQMHVYGPRCSEYVVYPYSFIFLMIQQLIQSILVIYMSCRDFWIPLPELL